MQTWQERSLIARGDARAMRLSLNPFAKWAIEREAAQLGVPVEELATFALLYYLADLDSGRVARRAPPPSAGRPAAG
jgi:hypothetical protein